MRLSGLGRRVIRSDRRKGKEAAMAHDEGVAEILRADLSETSGITETPMFGGLCFLHRGNMLCGVYGASYGFAAMYRVGKANMADALAIPGTAPMGFSGRPMGGIVDAEADLVADDARRAALLGLALGFVTALPPK
jgi:hypothetical protein